MTDPIIPVTSSEPYAFQTSRKNQQQIIREIALLLSMARALTQTIKTIKKTAHEFKQSNQQ